MSVANVAYPPSSTETLNQRWAILMMSQVHFNSQKTWALSKQPVGVCCRLHASYLANMQNKKKSDSQHVLHLLSFFFFHWHYVKLCEAVVEKCMYKIPLFVGFLRLLQKLLRLRDGGTEGDWRKRLILDSSRVDKNTAGVRFACRFTVFLRVTVSAVHPIHSPRSLSTSISVCVCEVNKAW